MKQTINHMPYDFGALSDALKNFRIFPAQTTKTVCNKRVAINRADHNAAITCDDCKMAIQHKLEMDAICNAALKGGK